MLIYQFLYCGCIHESSYATISVHKSKLGAYKAMNKYLNEQYNNWYNDRIIYGKERTHIDKFGIHESWTISSIDLKD